MAMVKPSWSARNRLTGRRWESTKAPGNLMLGQFMSKNLEYSLPNSKFSFVYQPLAYYEKWNTFSVFLQNSVSALYLHGSFELYSISCSSRLSFFKKYFIKLNN